MAFADRSGSQSAIATAMASRPNADHPGPTAASHQIRLPTPGVEAHDPAPRRRYPNGGASNSQSMESEHVVPAVATDRRVRAAAANATPWRAAPAAFLRPGAAQSGRRPSGALSGISAAPRPGSLARTA